jgi:hypothetical protein
MRILLIPGIALLMGACGGDDETEAEVIHTAEPCKVASDCKMDPGRASCRDGNTAVRYEEPSCGADQRCAWSKLEHHCDLRCEDGYCITTSAGD